MTLQIVNRPLISNHLIRDETLRYLEVHTQPRETQCEAAEMGNRVRVGVGWEAEHGSKVDERYRGLSNFLHVCREQV